MMQKDRALSLLIAMESALEDERFEVHSTFIDAFMWISPIYKCMNNSSKLPYSAWWLLP
jgi:hypothetical protein